MPETRLRHVPGRVPPMSEDIPRSPCGHNPQCAGGTQTGFEKHGLIQDGEQVRNWRLVWAQVCQLRGAHTAHLGAVWRAVWCNCVRPGAAWMRDEQSRSHGLCAGVSAVNPKKGHSVVKALLRWQTLTEI